MKKLFIISLLLFFSVLLSLLLKFDSNVVIYTNNYEIFTNVKFLFLSTFCFLLISFLLISIYYTILNTDKNKIIKNIKKEKKKNNLYLDSVYNGIVYGILGELNKAEKYFDKADKINNNKLTNIIKSQVLLRENELNNTVKSKKINELAKYNISLSKFILQNDNENIELYANKILSLQKNNKKCLNLLYKINKEKNNWEQCLLLINKIKNQFSKQDFKNEILSIHCNLSRYYFLKNDYNNSLKNALIIFDIDKKIVENNNILINSLQKLNSNKLFKYIEKIWAFSPDVNFGEIYINNQKNKINSVKKLYKINKNNIKSIVFYCNVLINNNCINMINKKVINELGNYRFKEVFEILLKIEEKEKENSLLTNSLKEKILNSKSIYDL